jgi:hypothetical protein
LQQEGWVGVAEFVDCARVKREEVGWDGVRQLGGVRAGAVEWSSGSYPSILECIPMYWGTPIFGNASSYNGAPKCMGMHSHIIGHPNIWGCIIINWDTPVYGDASPCARVPR